MLTGVTQRVTAAELEREPRMLHVVAWFDGWNQGDQAGYHGHVTRRDEFPRRLTTDEAASWREGWVEGFRGGRCHAVHGFDACAPELHEVPDG